MGQPVPVYNKLVTCFVNGNRTYELNAHALVTMTSLSIASHNALTWTLTGVCVILTAGRYAIRIKSAGRLKSDDALHGLAVLVLIGYAAVYTVYLPLKDVIQMVMGGAGREPSPDVLRRYLHQGAAIAILFIIVLYLVKFSFLALYKDVFGVSRRFMKAWWAIFIFTLLTLLACLLSFLWQCGDPQEIFNIDACKASWASNQTVKLLLMWCPLNVTSDILIMGLPLFMIEGLQMPMTRKLGLAVLFSLATIDVVFDIVRTVNTVKGGPLTIWDVLEPTTAVIVSCLPTYRTLFKTSRKQPDDAYRNLALEGKTATPARSRQEFEMHETPGSKDEADKVYAKAVSYSFTPLGSTSSGPAPVVVTDMV